MKAIRLLVFVTFLSGMFHPVVAQEKTRIRYAGNIWEFNKDIYEFGPRIIGNVVMSHDSAFLYCDSAWVNENENKVTAYGNVNIRLSDTLNLYSDSLRYDGNTRIANAYSNVRLIDNQTTLTTDTLIFDRNTQIGRYDWWGRIVNDSNSLTSKHGYYYTDKKEFFFKEKVILVNPEYRMFSDTLMYNTVTETSYFFGPSHIISNDQKDSIYCENGWYNSMYDIARFRKRARVYHETSYLTGDSMYYERRSGFGQVFRNAMLVDTAQNLLLTGNYGEMQRRNKLAFMTDSAVGVLIDRKDSLFMHADTVKATFDSLQDIREVFGFFRVKFFRHDLQGMCDSVTYTAFDSTMTMYRDPVLWSDSNQFSADTIILRMRNGEADSLKMFGSAFIISKDDTATYNQIKGRTLLGKFRDNELYKIRVLGNAQTIYYVREEDKSLIGINMVESGEILVFLDANKLKSITYIDSPEAHLYPEKSVPENQRKLRDFRWEQKRRPMEKKDIFAW